MKNETIRIEDKSEVADFLRSIGTECRFVTVNTETEVGKMPKGKPTGRKIPSPKTGKPINEKTPNPYFGTVKVARRNGFVNANFTKAVEKRYAELTGTPIEDVSYEAGTTWYQHCQTEDGKPLCLCEHQQDPTRQYMQFFPLRNLGETVYIHPTIGKLSAEQIKDMYDNWVSEDQNPEWKPRVIVLDMDSIRKITFRKINLLNETFSRIASTMSKWKRTRVSTRRPPVVRDEAEVEAFHTGGRPE